jgi:glutaredoxin
MRALPRTRSLLPWLVAVGAAMLASAAAADWLVTADGETIETKGPWKVKGRVVVFTDAKGALSSLRLDDLDLEASETVTADGGPQAAKPEPAAAEPEQPEREPVLVLTNADIPRGTEDRPAGQLTLTMYGTTSCGYCRRARKLFHLLGVTYVDKDVQKDPVARREYLEKTGGRTGVPVFDFGGVIMQGYSEEAVRAHVARLGLATKSE